MARVIIVGGGLGGLAAACTLGGRGHEVVLLERNDWLGGKACSLEQGGYRFDMGPTILTLPRVLNTVLEEAGSSTDTELDLVNLDPQWRCFFEEGSGLDLCQDSEQMAESLDRWAPERGLGEGYRNFMELAGKLRSVTEDYFFWKPVGGLADMLEGKPWFSPSGLKTALKMRPGRTVAGTVRRHLRDERVAQMADHYTQYVGSSPLKAPAVLCCIADMQSAEGVWYPMGGIVEVPRKLAEVAGKLGVELLTGRCVSRILTQDGRANGVETEAGERLFADAVLSNSDSVRTYCELLDAATGRAFDRNRNYEPACSGVVLFLALRERYEHLAHHNFVFSQDAREEFAAIYDRGEPAPDPTCYVCAPAVTDPAVAPDGGEALYVLVHTPYLQGHRWDELLPDYRETILDKLESTGGMTGLRDNIAHQAALTPSDIDRRYRVLRGAIYGLASHGRFTGAFKPSNRSPYVDGLYLCGGAAHPGPGMPMVLMSGWIAADALDRDLQ